MQESVDLAVDPNSPDAPVEESFFKEGVASEAQARDDGHALADDWSKRTRRLRIAASSAIATVGLVAIGLLIWGGPSAETPAAVAVVPPAAAAPAPAPQPPAAPAPVETPPPTPVAATPASAPAPVAPVAAAPAAPDLVQLEKTCRDAFGQKRHKDVLDNCARAFEAHASGDLAVLVAESELDIGRAASALTWAQKAVAADPNIADAYVFIGTAEQQAGHGQAARTAYLKYLELAPDGRFAQDLKAVVAGMK
jgi:tetratricopeptide (TPR) repeat protein